MAELRLPQDYQDLLQEFQQAQVEFLLIGGWAVAAHGHGRATDDIDLLVRPSADNAKRVYEALQRFGAPLQGVDAGLFEAERYGYRIGRKPLLIEILTAIDGVDFDEAAAEAITVDANGLMIPVIGKGALIKNKRAAGRAKDLADVQALDGD
ncbi:MAG TPA: hypothetical protein VFX59_25170 [Polyangiales bacterium]|nr:hypothetical protein [Polyangiales bacterium]